MKFDDYKPMLACPVDIDKVSKYPNYTMEVKLDGIRCIAAKDASGYVQMWTRSGKELHHKLPHIASQLRTIKGSFVLDGEIGYIQYSEGVPFPHAIDFNRTMRVLGSGPDIAEAKQLQYINEGSQPIKFFVFDILQKGNYPVSRLAQKDRRYGLIDLLTNLAKPEDIMDIQLSTEWSKWFENVYTEIVNLGGEGVMLKNPDAIYHIGKRKANTWYKVKAFDTVDCTIVDFDPGQGKYTGQIGALVVQPPQGQLVRISGMTDDQRSRMSKWFVTQYRGRKCEVRYFGKVGEQKDGYRHPQFVRMRPDLDTT